MRTDIHRPSAINPSEYSYVGLEHIKIESIGDCFAAQHHRQRINLHMERTGGTYATHEHGGNCMVCGAWCIYTVLFHHVPTNTYVRTGFDCADKMGYSDGGALSAFRRAIGDATKAHAGKRKAAAVLAEAGLDECWAIYCNGGAPFKHPTMEMVLGNLRYKSDGMFCTEADCDLWCKANREHLYLHKQEETIHEMVGKLVKYGSISEKQVNFLRTLLQRIQERPARLALRAAEEAKAEDCPEGRVVITGLVLSLRVEDSQYGTVIKILVKDGRGFKVWGSRPRAIWVGGETEGNAEVGDRVSFKATVTRSPDDPKFGFAKRPEPISLEKKQVPVEV